MRKHYPWGSSGLSEIPTRLEGLDSHSATGRCNSVCECQRGITASASLEVRHVSTWALIFQHYSTVSCFSRVKFRARQGNTHVNRPKTEGLLQAWNIVTKGCMLGKLACSHLTRDQETGLQWPSTRAQGESETKPFEPTDQPWRRKARAAKWVPSSVNLHRSPRSQVIS